MSNEIITGRDVLRLLADGVSVSDIEYRSHSNLDWKILSVRWYAVDLSQSMAQFRRKPKTRVINGFTVPEPVRERPHKGQEFYFADPTAYKWHLQDVWVDAEIDRVRLQRGLIFYDRDAAIATAKAMVGIDPNKEN